MTIGLMMICLMMIGLMMIAKRVRFCTDEPT